MSFSTLIIDKTGIIKPYTIKKYNEEELPVGSYYFIIEYNDDFTQSKTGIVSILK
jgi:hypothetical protein